MEARNGLLQFDEVLQLIDQSKDFKLRPSTIQRLQRRAIQDIYTCAGNYRTGPVVIEGTEHQPPPAHEVAELIEEMCEYVNSNWPRSALHLSAYVMWRLNWIHPFSGGERAHIKGRLVSCTMRKARVQDSGHRHNSRADCCESAALL